LIDRDITVTLNNTSIYAPIKTANNGHGKLSITDNSTIYGDVGALEAINFDAAYKTLTFDATYAETINVNAPIFNNILGTQWVGNINVIGGVVNFSAALGADQQCINVITIANGSVANFDSSIGTIYTYIEGNIDGNGILTTSGDGDLTFALGVGDSRPHTIDTTGSVVDGDNRIKFSDYANVLGGQFFIGSVPVEFASQFSGNIELSSDNSVIYVTGGNNGGAYANTITTATTGKGSIIISDNDFTISGTVGAANKFLNQIILNDIPRTVTLRGASIYSPIKTANNGEGVLFVTDGDSTVYASIGESGMFLNSIKLDNQTMTLDASHVDNIDVYAPFAGQDNTKGAITATKGSINFFSNIGDPTSLSMVDFGTQIGDTRAGTKIAFKGNATQINATQVVHKNATLSFDSDFAINSNIYTLQEETAFDVGVYKLTVHNTVNLSGDSSIIAEFVVDGQVALDLSQATIEGNLNRITFTVPNGAELNNTIKMIDFPLGVNVVNTLGQITLKGDQGWKIAQTPNILVYSPVVPEDGGEVTNTVTIPLASNVGAVIDFANGSISQIFPTVLPSGITASVAHATALGIQSTAAELTNLFNRGSVSISTAESAMFEHFTSSQIHNIPIILNMTLEANPTQDVPHSYSSVLAASLHTEGRISDFIANVMIDPTTPQEINNDLTRLGARNVDTLKQAVNIIQTASDRASSLASSLIATRVTFTATPSTVSMISPSVGGGVPVPAQASVSAGGLSNSVGDAGSAGNVQNTSNGNGVGENINTGSSNKNTNSTQNSDLGLGVAAGGTEGEYDRFGLWGSVQAGTANQLKYSNIDGFKSNLVGASIGVDTMLSDKASVGFVLSNAYNKIKHPNNSKGNKTNISSWVLGLYVNHELDDNWFIRTAAFYNITHSNNKEMRITAKGNGMAQAKYNMTSYGGEVSTGFNSMFDSNIVITPTAGLRIIHNDKFSYKEKGNTAQNNKISQKAVNTLSGLLGLSISKPVNIDDFNLLPEAHVNMQFALVNKAPSGGFVSALTPNVVTNYTGSKPNNLFTDIGASVTSIGDMIDISIAGDIGIMKKYTSYQGSLKVKVKF